MIYDYLLSSYQEGEPIFISEVAQKFSYSKDYVRQEMKRLTDEGKVERLYNGVYFLPYVTILGTKGRISVESYVKKKYLYTNGIVSGYITGLQLANEYGFTTQVPSCIEVCSNEATTKQRKSSVDGKNIIVYKPVTQINEKNRSALQFLDLISGIERYSELKEKARNERLLRFVQEMSVDFEEVKKALPLYPDKTYRNIYEGGLMNELV